MNAIEENKQKILAFLKRRSTIGATAGDIASYTGIKPGVEFATILADLKTEGTITTTTAGHTKKYFINASV